MDRNVTVKQTVQLQRNIKVFLQNMKPDKVASLLYEREIMPLHAMQDFEAIPTVYKRNQFLFTNYFLKAGTQRRLALMKDCLLSSEQRGLAGLIPVETQVGV